MILNLTSRATTPEQRALRVIDLPKDVQEELNQLLSFTTVPSPAQCQDRAKEIALLADNAIRTLRESKPGALGGHLVPLPEVMLDGNPSFMTQYLVAVLEYHHIHPLFPFYQHVMQGDNVVLQQKGWVNGRWDSEIDDPPAWIWKA